MKVKNEPIETQSIRGPVHVEKEDASQLLSQNMPSRLGVAAVEHDPPHAEQPLGRDAPSTGRTYTNSAAPRSAVELAGAQSKISLNTPNDELDQTSTISALPSKPKSRKSTRQIRPPPNAERCEQSCSAKVKTTKHAGLV